MPEYLPVVARVAKPRSRPRPIRPAVTQTAGFVGACRSGPVQGPPQLVTSFDDFRRTFGGFEDLSLECARTTNHLAHAVRSFFHNGGRRLFVARVFKPRAADPQRGYACSEVVFDPAHPSGAVDAAEKIDPFVELATTAPSFRSPAPRVLRFLARFPGAEANMPVRIRAHRSDSVLVAGKLVGVQSGDVVEVSGAPKPRVVGSSPFDCLDDLYVVRAIGPEGPDSGAPPARAHALVDSAGNFVPLTGIGAVQRVTFTVEVGMRGHRVDVYTGLSTHPASSSYIGAVLRQHDPQDNDARVYFGTGDSGWAPLQACHFADLAKRLVAIGSVTLTGGNDGDPPGLAEIRGHGAEAAATGLCALAGVPEIAIVAAPGSSAHGDEAERHAVRTALVNHCQNTRYRFAILSAPEDTGDHGITQIRGQHDTAHAALYYPWVTVFDPFSQTGETLQIPPDGAVAGVYARIAAERGAHASPADEPLRDALLASQVIPADRMERLNHLSINCIESSEDGEIRLRGARTLSFNPKRALVGVSRLLIQLEHSIEKSTRWVLFEPNDEELWQRTKRSVEAFLRDAWQRGALAGATASEAYRVRCDRTTMTERDLQNGRFVLSVSVAPLTADQMVGFRIEQWTGSAATV